MNQIAIAIILGTLLLFLYTYFGYPLLLRLVGSFTRKGIPGADPSMQDWPPISITVPAYNEARQIRGLIESLLALDYPRDRVHVLIVSDASSDGTDDIVREYRDRGIELLRLPERGGKTKAEAAAAEHLTGEIVVNTDASIRIHPGSLKPLIAVFRDPRIGLASGRDVSVSPGQSTENLSESGYVGYEMTVRDLETRVAGIIGASGCFYAIRPELHRLPLPDAFSRDFAAALHTIQHGFRAVSVPDAICYVPRTTSLRTEYRRKVRTIMRGMETLWHERDVMNPFRHPLACWMLLSHKVFRWAFPWAAAASLLALGTLAPTYPLASALVVVAMTGLALAAVGWFLDERGGAGGLFRLPAFVVAGNLAAAVALVRAFRGGRDATWEPTRREAAVARHPSAS